MYPKDFTEFLAIMNKLNIETNSSFSREDKEFLKSFIDTIKKEADRRMNP